MPADIHLIEQLKVRNILGEGVIWDERVQCLYWTDIEAKRLYSWGFAGPVRYYDCPERLGSFGLSQQTEQFICAFESGFAFFNPRTGETKWLSKVERDLAHTRLNDGRVDRQGRFWAGSYAERKGKGLGGLYRLEESGQSTKIIDNVRIANSLCWSPDGQTMYFADTATQIIQRADFDPATGDIKNLRAFIKTAENAFPDGACVDSEGYLWNAQWGSSTVKRYSPEGEEVLCLDVPCTQPSCVSFGGPTLQHLFVTSASKNLKAKSASEPANGSLFIYQTPFYGIPESIFKPNSI
ncbi:MAG: L-arabinonolactonase [Paraglaciecola sp.]|jgi:L-arabinonolactonase